MTLEYRNVKKLPPTSFEDYLKIEGLSYSTLKNMKDGVSTKVIETERMRLGKMADEILTNGFKVNLISFDDENFDMWMRAQRIAQTMIREFGDMIKHFSPQVSYTGNLHVGDLFIPTKGRLDWQLGKHAIIDLKVTHDAKNIKQIDELIEYMKYDNQVFHYGGLAKAHASLKSDFKYFIMIFSTKTNTPYIRQRLITKEDKEISENWLIEKVFEYGTVE